LHTGAVRGQETLEVGARVAQGCPMECPT
jgi:hypothetical protein